MVLRFKFLFVRLLCLALRPFVRVIDPRARSLSGQETLRPIRHVEVRFLLHRHHGDRPFAPPFTAVELDAAFLLEVPEAEVIGRGIVLDRTGAVILESALFQRDYLYRHHQDHLIVGHRFLRASRYEGAVSLLNILDRNYFHWITEGLPRLLLWRERLSGEDRPLLLDAGTPAFVRQSIHFFFGPNMRIVKDGHRRRRVQRCLLPSYVHTRNAATGWLNAYDPEIFRTMNGLALARVPSVASPVNLLLSRADGRERQIVNEERIVAEFPGLDLQVVRLGGMPFAEQVVLFARAGLVIAAHGAGLSNLLFARSPLVIELYPRTRPLRDLPYFLQISAALGIHHHSIECPTVNADQDMRVDDAVLGTMKQILREEGRFA